MFTVYFDSYGTEPAPAVVSGWREALGPVSGVPSPTSLDLTSF